MLNGGEIFDAGGPASVFTTGNISNVYGVEAIVNSDNGRPYIIPVKPTNLFEEEKVLQRELLNS